MAIKIKYHSPLPGTLTSGLVFSLLDAFLHFKNFIKALLQCGKCQREMHWRQIGISLIVKLLLLTDVLLASWRVERLSAGLAVLHPHSNSKCKVYAYQSCRKSGRIFFRLFDYCVDLHIREVCVISPFFSQRCYFLIVQDCVDSCWKAVTATDHTHNPNWTE